MSLPIQWLGPVWLRPDSGHGETVPGLVLSWTRDNIHSALDSGWVVLVATVPFGDALLVDHARAERILPVRDPMPVESTGPASGTATPAPAGSGSPSRRQRRHVWVDGADRALVPGLIVEWRRSRAGGDWEALVAVPGGRGGGVFIQWRPVGALRPVTDDSWTPRRG